MGRAKRNPSFTPLTTVDGFRFALPILRSFYSASPFNSRGTSPDNPAAWRMNMLFSGGARSTRPSPISRTVRSSVDLSENNAKPRGIDDHFGQRRDVLQAHIEPLPRDRMNHMRGVADQRQPLADEGARDEIAERKGAGLVERLDLAEMQAKALLEFTVKFVVAEFNDARRLLAVLGPHQRRAFSRQRQDRERPRRQ